MAELIAEDRRRRDANNSAGQPFSELIRLGKQSGNSVRELHRPSGAYQSLGLSQGSSGTDPLLLCPDLLQGGRRRTASSGPRSRRTVATPSAPCARCAQRGPAAQQCCDSPDQSRLSRKERRSARKRSLLLMC